MGLISQTCAVKITNLILCENCNHDVENEQHLIFDCENVKDIWYKIGVILDFSIQWRHILLGFSLTQAIESLF